MEPNPFFEPDFLTLASRAFDGFSKTRLLVASEGSEFQGRAPDHRRRANENSTSSDDDDAWVSDNGFLIVHTVGGPNLR